MILSVGLLLMRRMSSVGKRGRLRLKPDVYRPNAGMRNTLQNFGAVDFEDVAEDGELDDDILSTEQCRKEFIGNDLRRKNEVRFKIIQRKYFKEAQEVNLLTVAAKEQLRYLHQTDSKFWTPEKLAECFPISVSGVKKLLKSNFLPTTEENIAKHDQSVLKQWKRLKLKMPKFVSVGSKKLTDNLDSKSNSVIEFDLTNKASETVSADVGEFEALLHLPVSKQANVSGSLPSSTSYITIDETKSVQGTRYVSGSMIVAEMSKLFKSSNQAAAHSEVETLRDTKNDLKNAISGEERTALEMTDEGKLNGIYNSFTGKIKKYRDVDQPQVKWDVRQGVRNPHQKEPYLYDSKHGYQRPLGTYKNNT